MKLLTFTVPCYNSAAYMEHCVDTLLTGGDDVEIILVDDGSSDDTGVIADRYAQRYPEIVRVIHQPNGGHGEGVNQGIRNANGLYFKVVDSDDWLDLEALQKLLQVIRENLEKKELLDLYVCNYVYEHMEDHTQHIVNYSNVFPIDRRFTWEEMDRFRPSQFLVMHSTIYRTEVLRECGLELPKHTFYVDNIFVYQPLPYVKSIYYLNVDLYRYFIGREDQSVNEQVMIKRVDQQLRITRIMLDCYDLRTLAESDKKLSKYMVDYLAMMMAISSIFLILSEKPENIQKKKELWMELKQKDIATYHKIKRHIVGIASNLPGDPGRRLSVKAYKLVQKIYKFN